MSEDYKQYFKKPMTESEEEAFERFCIMTVDGKVSDETAAAEIINHYGFKTAFVAIDKAKHIA